MQGNEPLTILTEGTAEFTVQRSRFIACIAAVHDEEEARAFVARLRKEHYDARHCCSAWILGADGAKQKSSDDGEPGGLVRAYSHAAAIGIDAATLARRVTLRRLSVTVGYETLSAVEHWARQKKIRVGEAAYAEKVTLPLLLEPVQYENAKRELTDLTAAKAVLEDGDEEELLEPIEKTK